MKKVIITGATGMVGKGILLECLDHQEVDEVLVIGRSTIGMKHQKLKEIIKKDFSDFADVADQLRGYDACFYALGISAAGLSEDQYHKITYGFTFALAEILLENNAEMTFNYVSGEGTDSSEKGRMMWARVKGKTENDLINYGFRQTYMFRPGVILPRRGIKSKTKSYQFMYDYFMWLVRLIKAISPNAVVSTTQIGLAMINSMSRGYDKKVLRPKDIIKLSELK
jgi:uncharacterized protein YbjT (DUF2867 family)